jgi:NAD-dependent SIR2 family protein deacetylase
VHDHQVGTCEKCGCAPVLQVFEDGKTYPGMYKKVGVDAKDLGTKDTHINFGEYLDDIDWQEAEEHCGKSDLVIVAGIYLFCRINTHHPGTSMTLRHITHFPFMAQENTFGNTSKPGRVVIINLQKTPDDKKCDLRIFSDSDSIFSGKQIWLYV